MRHAARDSAMTDALAGSLGASASGPLGAANAELLGPSRSAGIGPGSWSPQNVSRSAPGTIGDTRTRPSHGAIDTRDADAQSVWSLRWPLRIKVFRGGA